MKVQGGGEGLSFIKTSGEGYIKHEIWNFSMPWAYFL